MTEPTDEAPGPEAETGTPLRCLGGGVAPPQIAADLAQIASLPAAAQRRLWEALGPSLGEPVPPAVERVLDEFCRRYAAPDAVVARALKACRFLIREASQLDLPRAAFAEDLAVLGAPIEVRDLLLAGYEQARAVVRAEILRGALFDHGRVLLGVDWRLDTISASSRGARLEAPVVMLTLRYQDGEEVHRLSVQAVPDALRDLQRMCAQILGG